MPAKILIVEDEPDLLEALRVRLVASGFACQTATNGKKGLAVLGHWQPDLIITDLLMPEMNGYEFYRYVRTDSRTASIPIIVLTAVPQYTLEQRSEDLLGARILHKPFDSATLLSVVQEVLTSITLGGSLDG